MFRNIHRTASSVLVVVVRPIGVRSSCFGRSGLSSHSIAIFFVPWQLRWTQHESRASNPNTCAPHEVASVRIGKSSVSITEVCVTQPFAFNHRSVELYHLSRSHCNKEAKNGQKSQAMHFGYRKRTSTQSESRNRLGFVAGVDKLFPMILDLLPAFHVWTRARTNTIDCSCDLPVICDKKLTSQKGNV